ncbi:unnamed protein product [Coregonus sp. 'balchen']|nr:unnamed protein product [Coregonus sp. 'balchen']
MDAPSAGGESVTVRTPRQTCSAVLSEGEVDCWPLACPVLSCKYSALAEGECCPHCVTDPCVADNIAYDIRQTCQDPTGITRLSSATFYKEYK